MKDSLSRTLIGLWSYIDMLGKMKRLDPAGHAIGQTGDWYFKYQTTVEEL